MNPTTIVAFAMNGQPLPQRHGYPARIVVPGLYGEKNVKWVTRIEVIDYDAKGFYESKAGDRTSSSPPAPISSARAGSAIAVTPSSSHSPSAGRATIRGRAFAGDRGIQRVEFSADDGETWQDARIDYPGTELTWTFWSADWLPKEPGEYTLVSRATDGTGAPQPTRDARHRAAGSHRLPSRRGDG